MATNRLAGPMSGVGGDRHVRLVFAQMMALPRHRREREFLPRTDIRFLVLGD